MSFNDWFQINYATQDHISTVGLTEVFSAIDSANRAGYLINHSNDPQLLMIDPEHLFDVADSLGCPIQTTKNKLEVEFKKLIWPKYLGEREFRTAMWPSNKRVRCWTFDINKSESNMTYNPLNNPNSITANDTVLLELERLSAAIGIWRDSVNTVPVEIEIKLISSELATVLTQYHDQLHRISQQLRTENIKTAK